MRQAENAPVFTLPISRTYMVGVIRTIKPRFLGLFCGKIASLTFRHREKPGFGFMGRPFHNARIAYLKRFLPQHK
jgi:hypothetical protein